MSVHAVGADAGLAAVAELAGERTFDGFVQIGIVKHDKRRVAAQFQTEFFNVRRAVGKNFRADFGRTGEADFAHGRVRGKFMTDFRSATADNGK